MRKLWASLEVAGWKKGGPKVCLGKCQFGVGNAFRACSPSLRQSALIYFPLTVTFMSKGFPVPPHNPCLLSKVEIVIRDHLSLNLTDEWLALQTYGVKIVKESWAHWKMCCD